MVVGTNWMRPTRDSSVDDLSAMKSSVKCCHVLVAHADAIFDGTDADEMAFARSLLTAGAGARRSFDPDDIEGYVASFD